MKFYTVNSQQLLAINYFYKKFLHRCFAWSFKNKTIVRTPPPPSKRKVGGYNGGDGKFSKSLDIVERDGNPLISWRPHYIAYPPLFKCCPPPSPLPPTSLSHPTPTSTVLLSCFFSWMGDHTKFDVLFYLMIISIYTCQALVP